jgi:Ca2+-binding RTX toxin-like protein
MSLNPDVAPSGNFDLSNWKITLPVDSSGGTSGTAVEVSNLIGYQNSKYFYTAPDGAMVFYAPVNGATTSGSSYARSELREMNGSAKAAWNLSTGGSMTATLEVDAAPMRDGQGHKIVVGQIHGQDDELVRLYWQDNKLYFANDQSGSDNEEHNFNFKADDGSAPDVSLNEKFSYTINAKGNTLDVDIYADGKVYHSHTSINSVWQSDTFYFKAGAYLGANESNGSGYGQTSFYDLRFTHSGALTPTDPGVSDPAPTDPPPTDPDATPADPAPVPSDDPTLPKIGAGITQLEAMKLTNITTFSAKAATGGIAVESRTEDAEGKATATFNGESGSYNLKLDYFDENDGLAQFGIRINGQAVNSWVADRNLGSSVADTNTLTSTSLDLTLRQGDMIEVYAMRKGGDMARVDDITLTKLSTTPTEPTPTGPAPTDPVEPTPTDPSAGQPSTTRTIEGSNSNNYVIGASDNELLKGNAGRDVLWGKAGSDVLYGGNDSDADAFVFDTAIGKDVDWLMDFNSSHDLIRLENSIFKKLTKTGSLPSSFFTVGEQAKDANDYVVYNKNTGDLSYDADGSGSGSAVKFAVIHNKAALAAADFLVI